MRTYINTKKKNSGGLMATIFVSVIVENISMVSLKLLYSFFNIYIANVKIKINADNT